MIRGNLQDWEAKQAEKVVERHIKKPKFFIPHRIEIACLIELSKLFDSEDIADGSKKWLDTAYGDTASYPQVQESIKNSLRCQSKIIETRTILNPECVD